MSQNPPGAATDTVQTIQTAMTALERIRDQCNTVLNTLGPILATFNGPTAASYRTKQPCDRTKCVGRIMVNRDTRFTPAVYAEAQCGNDIVPGSDICAKCIQHHHDTEQRYAQTGSYYKNTWNGRITDEPPEFTHMLGTTWAAKCKWNGDAQTV